MFNFFKKVKDDEAIDVNSKFDVELIGCVLAYEVAMADGSIDTKELKKIKTEVFKKSIELNADPIEILETIKIHNEESVSFNDFINQINNKFSQDQKLEMIYFLWQTAYSDNLLDVDEERLIRRIADMIRIKDMQVLKLKHQAKLDS
jgi:uncharacterized tellurite resistance protein B-like protein